MLIDNVGAMVQRGDNLEKGDEVQGRVFLLMPKGTQAIDCPFPDCEGVIFLQIGTCGRCFTQIIRIYRHGRNQKVKITFHAPAPKKR